MTIAIFCLCDVVKELILSYPLLVQFWRIWDPDSKVHGANISYSGITAFNIISLGLRQSNCDSAQMDGYKKQKKWNYSTLKLI